MTKNKVVALVNLWDQFEADHPGADLADFCRHYLLSQQAEPASDPHEKRIPLEGRLSAAIYRMNKFTQFYARKLMVDTPMSNMEDFIYLATVLDHEQGDMRKSEVIHRNFSEFTSGISVIRRLVDRQFLEEYDDPDDARSRRVRITPLGRATLYQSLGSLGHLAQIMYDCLTDAEKRLALRILYKATQHHAHHYPHNRGLSGGEIVNYMTGKGIEEG
ncbi:MAG: winged helix DNA-binding protein [Bacteroidia bacterium]|nr:winged helix DNA-binding protein [Bacteroidia bacterium]